MVASRCRPLMSGSLAVSRTGVEDAVRRAQVDALAQRYPTRTPAQMRWLGYVQTASRVLGSNNEYSGSRLRKGNVSLSRSSETARADPN